jgi:DNA-binding LytR/AlgR family response regulator
MHAMQELLGDNACIRIHKSYIISIDCIEAIKGNECVIKLGDVRKTIPIGNKFRNEFMNKLQIV